MPWRRMALATVLGVTTIFATSTLATKFDAGYRIQDGLSLIIPADVATTGFDLILDAMVTVVIAGPGVLLAVAVIAASQREPRPGRCAGCGYDLTGNESGVCPECGRKV